MTKLTHEEIDAMEAGSEMDALLAELVMGWEKNKDITGWRPSQEFGDAWWVVNEMERKDIPTQWRFVDALLEKAGDIVEFIFWLKPIYISRAALKAVTE